MHEVAWRNMIAISLLIYRITPKMDNILKEYMTVSVLFIIEKNMDQKKNYHKLQP